MVQKNNTQPASDAWSITATFILSLCKLDLALSYWLIFSYRTPEVFEIIPKTVKVTARKNLAQVSKVLTQIITARHFGDDQPTFMPINDFVGEASGRMCAWLLEGVINSLFFWKAVLIPAVADVPDAESYFYAHEFLDVTVQPKPIYISPNEVYTIHGLLLQHLRFLVRRSNLISQQGLRSR